MAKTLDQFKVQLSSVPQATFDSLSSLEWVRATENLCLVGPAGTGKSHLLVGLGHAAVAAGFRVRYFSAAELVETLDRGLADNSVGRVLEALLRADLVICDELGFAPLDGTGSQLLFRFVAAARGLRPPIIRPARGDHPPVEAGDPRLLPPPGDERLQRGGDEQDQVHQADRVRVPELREVPGSGSGGVPMMGSPQEFVKSLKNITITTMCS